MKRLCLFVLLAFATTSAWAEPSPAAPASAAKGKRSPTGHVAAEDVLLRAYQKELAVLVAEKRELERRLQEADKGSTQRREVAKTEIRALEDQLVALTLRADRADDRLAAVERETDAATEGDDAVATIVSQAAREEGREPPEEVSAADLRQAFASSLAKTKTRASLRRAPGKWFDEAGREVSGTLLHVGAVAAFGKSDRASGALAPAGGGALKVWHQSDAAQARAVVDGEPVQTLGLMLFESTDTAMEPKKEKTVLQIMKAAGAIGWVIGGLGVLALLLVLARAALLFVRGRGSERLFAEVPALVMRGDLENALALCRRLGGSMGRVLETTLRSHDKSRDERADRSDEKILSEMVAIDRFGAMILVFAGVAPLLGLLGTVTGMIATFDAITEFGTGDPRLLSGGISEALITTELGLIVAIPSLLLGNLLSGVGERLKRRLEAGALRVANAVEDGLEPTPSLEPVLVDTAAKGVVLAKRQVG